MQYAREKAEHLAAQRDETRQPISISESIEYSDGSNENFSGFGEGFHSARLPLLKTKCSCLSPQTSLVQNPEKEELSDEEEDLLLSPVRSA